MTQKLYYIASANAIEVWSEQLKTYFYIELIGQFKRIQLFYELNKFIKFQSSLGRRHDANKFSKCQYAEGKRKYFLHIVLKKN